MHEKYKAALAEFRALSQKATWTTEEETRAAELKTEMESLKADISRDNHRLEARRYAETHHEFLSGAGGNSIEHEADPENGGASVEKRGVEKQTLHAVAEMRGKVKNLSNPKIAYRFGQFLRATLGSNVESRTFCKNAGIEIRAARQLESDNSLGGYLVPVEFDNEILDLREKAGVIRRLARNTTMTTDTKIKKVREGGLKAFPVGEAQRIPVDTKSWGAMELKARKIGVITRYTNELSQDAVINLADDLAGEMGLAFAEFEDAAGFIGDGSAQYHSLWGLIPSLKGMSNTIANIPGLQKASGNNWDSITRADLLGVMGRLSTLTFNRSPAWMCSVQFYFNVMERLIEEAGGTTRAEMVNGKPTYYYKGFPVELIRFMPTLDEGPGSVPLLFGDPYLSMMFGDRQGLTLGFSAEATVEGESLFEQDEMAIRATERFDLKVFNLGNADPDPKKRTFGGMAGLIL